MSSQLIPFQKPGELDLASLNEIGSIFSKSGYFKDVRDAAQAIVKIMYGRELGFSPVISMSGIHIIEGKPALSANLMGAMIKRSGKYNYRVAELTDTNCTLQFTEQGVDVGVSSFSKGDAEKAGVWGRNTWGKYPRNMMFARALSNGLKMFCPDLSMCPIYNPEEMGAEVNGEGEVVSLPASVAAPKVTAAPVSFGVPKVIEPLPPLETLVETAQANAPLNSFVIGMLDKAAVKEPDTDAEERNQKDGGLLIELSTLEQQSWLAKEFRNALPEKFRPHADQLRKAALADAGWMDEKHVGTSKVIPRKDFKVVAKRLLDAAAKVTDPQLSEEKVPF